MTKKATAATSEQLNKAKEALLKSETVKEVARTKESQLLKDHEAYDKQIEVSAREIQKLREQVQTEVRRREDLVQAHHEDVQKIQIQRETDLDAERRQR